MDALDVRILRAMQFGRYGKEPRPDALKPSYLAKAVGTTAETVRTRVAGMLEEGVIVGFQAQPNLHHLGLAAEGSFHRAAAPGLVDDVAAVPGVIAVHDYFGEGMCIEYAFCDAEDQASTLKQMSAITGDDKPLPFFDGVMPPVAQTLTPLDWRIVQALRWDARRSLREVAEDVGVTTRTVERRFAKLATHGSLITAPMLDPSRAGGLLLFEMFCFLAPGPRAPVMQGIAAAFDENQVMLYVPKSPDLGHFNVLAWAATQRDVERLRAAAEAVPGVARAEAWLFRRFVERSGWLDERIAAHVAPA